MPAALNPVTLAALSMRLAPPAIVVRPKLNHDGKKLHSARKKEACRSTTSPKASPDVKLPDAPCKDRRFVNIP